MNSVDQGHKQEAAKIWAQRAQAECGAEQRFRQLALHMEHFESPRLLLRLVKEAIKDEHRHAKVCAAVAKDFGHRSGFEIIPGTPSVETHWLHELDPRDRFLYEVVQMGCITETINASLLNTIHSTTRASQNRMTGIIKAILDDEVKHGQLGWALLAYEASIRDISFLGGLLHHMLDTAVRDELFDVSFNEVDDGAALCGILPESYRLNQFVTTLEQVIMPGFSKLGVNASSISSWLSSRLSQSQLVPTNIVSVL